MVFFSNQNRILNDWSCFFFICCPYNSLFFSGHWLHKNQRNYQIKHLFPWIWVAGQKHQQIEGCINWLVVWLFSSLVTSSEKNNDNRVVCHANCCTITTNWPRNQTFLLFINSLLVVILIWSFHRLIYINSLLLIALVWSFHRVFVG